MLYTLESYQIGIESYHKFFTHFYIKDFAKIAIMQFIFSFLIVTDESLLKIVIVIN